MYAVAHNQIILERGEGIKRPMGGESMGGERGGGGSRDSWEGRGGKGGGWRGEGSVWRHNISVYLESRRCGF